MALLLVLSLGCSPDTQVLSHRIESFFEPSDNGVYFVERTFGQLYKDGAAWRLSPGIVVWMTDQATGIKAPVPAILEYCPPETTCPADRLTGVLRLTLLPTDDPEDLVSDVAIPLQFVYLANMDLAEVVAAIPELANNAAKAMRFKEGTEKIDISEGDGIGRPAQFSGACPGGVSQSVCERRLEITVSDANGNFVDPLIFVLGDSDNPDDPVIKPLMTKLLDRKDPVIEGIHIFPDGVTDPAGELIASNGVITITGDVDVVAVVRDEGPGKCDGTTCADPDPNQVTIGVKELTYELFDSSGFPTVPPQKQTVRFYCLPRVNHVEDGSAPSDVGFDSLYHPAFEPSTPDAGLAYNLTNLGARDSNRCIPERFLDENRVGALQVNRLDLGTTYTLRVGATDHADRSSSQPSQVKIVFDLPDLDLDIHKPAVTDPAQSAIPDDQEHSVGAQTWINLDNDDRDTLFDLGNTDIDVVGEDEMVKIVLRIESEDLSTGALVLTDTRGGSDIKIWRTPSKGTEYHLGTPLDIPTEFTVAEGSLVKELWIEGVSAHTVQRQTVLQLAYQNNLGRMPLDEVALTILGVKNLDWKGRQNGFTPGSTAHNSNILDADPHVTAVGSNRVFAGARTPHFNTALNKVDLEVELSVAPIEPVDLFLRSFDIDDPSSDTTFIDPNDSGGAGDYAGTVVTALTYTADEDNRGEVAGLKAGHLTDQDADAILALSFDKGESKKTAEFTVSLNPGDNYRNVANGDRDFVRALRNRDRDDGFRIVDPAVAAPANDREIREAGKYSSEILSVWRLLHIERDSMTAIPAAGPQSNMVTGKVTSIDGTALLAQSVSLDVNLAAGLPSGADTSTNLSNTGKGRFEKGVIRLGASGVATGGLDGNGDNFVQRNAGISVPFIVQASAGAPGAPPNATGNVVGLDGSVLTLNVTGGALTPEHNGGVITVAGEAMNVIAVNVGASKVTAMLVDIPFILVDDDSGSLPHSLDLSGLFAYQAASVLPVLDGGGNMANNDQIVGFKLNGPNTSAGEVALYNARRASKDNEENAFWVVYICAAWQDFETNDNDADAESAYLGSTSPFGTTHNFNLAIGGDGALIWRESELDMVQEGSWPNIGHEARNVAHEIGHQFGLGHGNAASPGGEVDEFPNMGLMHPTLSALVNADSLIPRHLNLIRCRIRSPGE